MKLMPSNILIILLSKFKKLRKLFAKILKRIFVENATLVKKYNLGTQTGYTHLKSTIEFCEEYLPHL